MSYMITSLVMFYLAGIMALLIRLQLTSPTLVSFSPSGSTTSCSPCTAA
jgi:heme/copper-type cytochrome/quinol oxidase subunit 1